MNLFLRTSRWYLVVLAIGVAACSGEPTSIPTDPGAIQSIRRLEARAEHALTGWAVDSMAMANDPRLSHFLGANSQGAAELAALADEEPSPAVLQLISTTASTSPLEVRASTQYIGNSAKHSIIARIVSGTPANDPPPWTFDPTGTGTWIGSPFNLLFSSQHPITASVACDFSLSASTTHTAWWQAPTTPWAIINAMIGSGIWGQTSAGSSHSASGPSCATTQQPPGQGGGVGDESLEPDETWYICTTFYVYVGGVLAQIIDGGCTPV